MSVKEAVGKYVHDGDYLGIGGFGANRIPTAVCHEIVRQKRKNLIFAGHTSTHDFQILSAGEVFQPLRHCLHHRAGGQGTFPQRPPLHGKRESGGCEWTNYGMALRFKAAAMGVSFLPGRNMMGTDTFKYSAAKVVKCPLPESCSAFTPPCGRMWRRSMFTRPIFTGTAGLEAYRSPTWSWPGPPSA